MVLVVVALLGVVYVRGGDRLSLVGYGAVGPTFPDVEFHVFVSLGTAGGGEVELVSARAVGASAGVDADVQLVRLASGEPVGTLRGRLPERFVVEPLEGHVVAGPAEASPYWLDVRLIPAELGVVRLDAVAVTYRDGALRERTAERRLPVCLVAMHLPLEDVECPPP